ncbi:hypothetical protein QYF61_008546, partial [Mycteria americana]
MVCVLAAKAANNLLGCMNSGIARKTWTNWRDLSGGPPRWWGLEHLPCEKTGRAGLGQPGEGMVSVHLTLPTADIRVIKEMEPGSSQKFKEGDSKLCIVFPYGDVPSVEGVHGVPPTGDSPPGISPAKVLSMGCSPSGADCSRVGPPRGPKSCQQTCSRVGSSSEGHRSCQEPAPAWGLHGVTASFGRIHLLWRGVLHRLQLDICSTVDLHGLQGDSLPHHGLHHGLQGNLCSGAWSTSSPSFFTDLVPHWGSKEDRARFFSLVLNNRTRGNGHKLKHRTFCLSVRKHFSNVPEFLYELCNEKDDCSVQCIAEEYRRQQNMSDIKEYLLLDIMFEHNSL